MSVLHELKTWPPKFGRRTGTKGKIIMRSQILASVGLVLSLAVAACGGNTGEAAPEGEDSQEVVSARANLKGSWVLQSEGKAALELRPDGTFFRDRVRVLNGVFLPGHVPGLARDKGTYKVSGSTLSLKITEGQLAPANESFSFTFKAPILNGVFLPGHEPSATLVLTRQPAPGSHIAFRADTYKRAESWCTATADCVAERADKTWIALGHGTASEVSCNVAANACELTAPANVSQKHGACGDDVAVQKKCAAGLTCIFPQGFPISEHTAGTCEEVSAEGEACGDDVAIQKQCALGLTCVLPKGGPISEHTAGTCQ